MDRCPRYACAQPRVKIVLHGRRTWEEPMERWHTSVTDTIPVLLNVSDEEKTLRGLSGPTGALNSQMNLPWLQLILMRIAQIAERFGRESHGGLTVWIRADP